MMLSTQVHGFFQDAAPISTDPNSNPAIISRKMKQSRNVPIVSYIATDSIYANRFSADRTLAARFISYPLYQLQ